MKIRGLFKFFYKVEMSNLDTYFGSYFHLFYIAEVGNLLEKIIDPMTND